MTKFLDGPAAGVILALRRAPIFLRVVRSPTGWDALDQRDDEPAADEAIFAYRLQGESQSIHIHGSKVSGWYEAGNYRVLADQPPEPAMRSKERWHEWTYATYEAEKHSAGAQ